MPAFFMCPVRVPFCLVCLHTPSLPSWRLLATDAAVSQTARNEANRRFRSQSRSSSTHADAVGTDEGSDNEGAEGGDAAGGHRRDRVAHVEMGTRTRNGIRKKPHQFKKNLIKLFKSYNPESRHPLWAGVPPPRSDLPEDLVGLIFKAATHQERPGDDVLPYRTELRSGVSVGPMEGALLVTVMGATCSRWHRISQEPPKDGTEDAQLPFWMTNIHPRQRYVALASAAIRASQARYARRMATESKPFFDGLPSALTDWTSGMALILAEESQAALRTFVPELLATPMRLAALPACLIHGLVKIQKRFDGLFQAAGCPIFNSYAVTADRRLSQLFHWTSLGTYSSTAICQLPPLCICGLIDVWLCLQLAILWVGTLGAPWFESRPVVSVPPTEGRANLSPRIHHRKTRKIGARGFSGFLRRVARSWTALVTIPYAVTLAATHTAALVLPSLLFGAFWGLPAPLTLAPAAPHRAWVEPVIRFICDLWGVTPGTSLMRPAMIAATVTQYACGGLAVLLLAVALVVPVLAAWVLLWELVPRWLQTFFSFIGAIGTGLFLVYVVVRPLWRLALEVIGFDPTALRFTLIWFLATYLWMLGVFFMLLVTLECIGRRLPFLAECLQWLFVRPLKLFRTMFTFSHKIYRRILAGATRICSRLGLIGQLIHIPIVLAWMFWPMAVWWWCARDWALLPVPVVLSGALLSRGWEVISQSWGDK
ncbi:hypothetical protein PAPYR_1425 [Paratrimastix pyriformis]|uniref:Uncharacterized protein n=1 Tax=Paratrimastix pyriformis TaxID=342808 RepID=A0ABQ8USX0_9EUKA|nr:hypothetical protein PAPYR_1425 [Paratrimastix pyriformis]